MKYPALSIILIICILCLSCKNQPYDSTNINHEKEQNTPLEKPQTKVSPTSAGYEDCRAVPLGISSVNEVEIDKRKIKVWATSVVNKNKSKLKNDLYYQVNDAEVVLVTKTELHSYLSDIDISPNGNWVRATFNVSYPAGKNSETAILINLKNGDFIKWTDIDKRIGRTTENKLYYNSCWAKEKAATIIYLKTDETKGYLDLPDKMPTSKQDLFEATGFGK
jgi:hypothetical protein